MNIVLVTVININIDIVMITVINFANIVVIPTEITKVETYLDLYNRYVVLHKKIDVVDWFLKIYLSILGKMSSLYYLINVYGLCRSL